MSIPTAGSKGIPPDGGSTGRPAAKRSRLRKAFIAIVIVEVVLLLAVASPTCVEELMPWTDFPTSTAACHILVEHGDKPLSVSWQFSDSQSSSDLMSETLDHVWFGHWCFKIGPLVPAFFFGHPLTDAVVDESQGKPFTLRIRIKTTRGEYEGIAPIRSGIHYALTPVSDGNLDIHEVSTFLGTPQFGSR